MEERVSESRQRRRARERKQRKGAASAALTLGVALAASPAAQAATFNVTNLDDAGAGSLRQAIEDANGAAGADTITFDPGLNGGAVILTSGQLSITDSVDIQGPGAANLAVTANDASRVFYLYNGAASLDVTISGLTITGGNADIGGGIVNFDENLTLDGVTLTGNSASVDGGGLWADGFSMNLTIRDSVITGNAASDDGGGIYVEDTGGLLLIQNTVISGNQANDKGGGIYFYDPDDDVTIDNSTISGNTAGSLGGGIYLYSPDDGNWLITNTTISGNDAAAGGGLFFYSADHPLLVQNSTISGNQATAGDGGGIYFYNLYSGNATLDHTTVATNSATGSGGGIFLQTTELSIANSIVADNTAATDNDLSNGVEATFNTSFSLIESPGAATLNDTGGTVLNQDPQLGPLQNNGGTTLTQRPAPTSPAVNTGDPAFAPPPATDQRGTNRVQNGRTDMGAVEVGPSGTIQLTVTSTSVNENGSTVTITATRTGGSDGAVSVSFSTSDGTAQSPGDYTGTVGTLSWADGDTAPKSFNVAIIDDALTEPSETFSATISNPQGGATLGAAVTEVVTIVDNDAAAAVPVPTVGEYGLMLLTALFGLGGVLMIRRKKGLAAPMLVVSMTLGAAGAPAEAAARPSRAETRVTTVAQIQAQGEEIVIRLSDGTTYRIGEKSFQLIDGRKGRGRRGTTPELRSIQAGQPVFLKVRHDPTGKVKRVRLELADSAADAQARMQAQRD